MDDGRNRLSHDAGCVIAGAVFFGYFLLLPKESNETHANKIGTTKIPNAVAHNMPPTTAAPMPFRAAEPAPSAVANGMHATINASEVIKIGRNLSVAASTAARAGSMPPSTFVFANSTISIAFKLLCK